MKPDDLDDLDPVEPDRELLDRVPTREAMRFVAAGAPNDSRASRSGSSCSRPGGIALTRVDTATT